MLTSADAELIRRDPHLPGLALLLDAEALRQRLDAFLPGLHDHASVCSYLRYKPGTNCLAAYRIDSPAPGAAQIQLHAKAFRSRTDPKFLKEAYELQGNSKDSQRLLIQDAALSIRLFPKDDRLQALAALFSPGRGRLLRKLLPESPELWESALEVLRYKPERRCVLRLDAPVGPKASVRCYSPTEFAGHDSAGFVSSGVLRIPKRLGRSRRHQLLLFEWVTGRPLKDFFSADSDVVIGRVGEALAELHLQDVHGLKFRTRRREARELRAIAIAIGQLCPPLAERSTRVVENLADKLLIRPPMVCPVHGDFYADQVLVSDDQIVILDLDEAVFGDGASDIGTFLAHLDCEVIAGWLTPSTAENLAEGFVEGYRQMLPIGQNDVDAYRAAALFRFAPHPFRSRQANWPDQIERIIDRGESLLGTGVRARPQKFTVHTAIENHAPFGIAQDQKFSFAMPALDPKKVIARFQQMSSGPFRESRMSDLRAIRVVRHKPGQRFLIEYEFSDSQNTEPAGETTLIGKVRAKRPDLASYRIQQMLFRNGFGPGNPDGVEVPEPVDVFPEWHMWLQRKVRGETATHLLETNQGNDRACQIAQAIYRFHNCRAVSRRRHIPRDELQILHERLPKVARSRKDWRDPIRKILEACDHLAKNLPDEPTALIHRDFYPDQLLIDSGRTIVLDLDLCCAGDPALDIGNFHAHLTEQALRRFGCENALAAVQSVFVDHYALLAGEELRSRIEAYATLSLVRHIYISTLFPDRRHLTEPLMELCAKCLKIRLKLGGRLASSTSKPNLPETSQRSLYESGKP